MKTTLRLQNIKCSGCTDGIAVRLLKLSGINDVQISNAASEVTFSYETVNDLANAERTLILMGYPPEGIENTIKNKANSLISCAVGRISG